MGGGGAHRSARERAKQRPDSVETTNRTLESQEAGSTAVVGRGAALLASSKPPGELMQALEHVCRRRHCGRTEGQDDFGAYAAGQPASLRDLEDSSSADTSLGPTRQWSERSSATTTHLVPLPASPARRIIMVLVKLHAGDRAPHQPTSPATHGPGSVSGPRCARTGMTGYGLCARPSRWCQSTLGCLAALGHVPRPLEGKTGRKGKDCFCFSLPQIAE